MVAMLLSVSSLHAQGTAAQGSATCRPAGSGTNALIQRLTYWMTTTDPQKIQLRNNAYHIPVVPTSTLVAITDQKTCRKAGGTYASQLGTTPAPVDVVRGGSGNSTFYAVHDPTVGTQPGGFGAVLLLDKTFKRIGGWSF
jgi:hypothetical protein